MPDDYEYTGDDEPKRLPTLEERVERMEKVVAICAKVVTTHNLMPEKDRWQLQAFWEDIE